MTPISWILLIALPALFLIPTALNGAETPDWEKPKYFGEGKEAPHCTLMPFPDEGSALKKDRTDSPFYQSLNGPWKFASTS